MEYKCHNCGEVSKFETPLKEFVCQHCGAVNVVPDVPDRTSDEPLGCLAPTSFEWTLPAGRIESVTGQIWYVTAQGTHMTRPEYIAAFGFDPEIALKKMRNNRGVRLGRKV